MALSRQQFSAFEIATSPYKVGLFGGATANSGSTSSPTVVEVESITP